MLKPVSADCSRISVVISIAAPASRTKHAAVCVTAKIRSRRFVPPVIRTLLPATPRPCAASALGSRGTNARSTAATSARPVPT